MKYLYLTLSLLLALPHLYAQDSKTCVWDIQLATFSVPKAEDFKNLKTIGYCYEVKLPTGLSKILLGSFTDEPTMRKKLDAVKKKGYKGAFAIKSTADEKDAVYIVHLAAYNFQEAIQWTDWQVLSEDLVVQLNNGKVRIAAGSYKTQKEADEELEKLIKMGAPKDISVKKVSSKFIHTVTPFETGEGSVKPAKDVLDKRFVMDLQKVLKMENYYTATPDGSLNEETKTSLDRFKLESRRYQNAYTLAMNDLKKDKISDSSVPVGSLAYYIYLIKEKPFTAEENLKKINSPLASAYLAYIYLNNLITAPNQKEIVNAYMSKATSGIKKIYKGATRYDYSQKYVYEDLQQWFNHFRDIQMATSDEVPVPCWLFERHPVEAMEAFKPYWGSNKDTYIIQSGCAGGSSFEELRVLTQLAADMDPQDEIEKNSTASSERSQELTNVNALFLSPQVLPSKEAAELNDWHTKIVSGLESWANTGRLQRRMINTLLIAYYESLIKTEYYFLNEGFRKNDAHALALKIVKSSVNYHLKGYVKS